MRAREAVVPRRDAAAVAALRAGGAVIVGTTNMAEAAVGAVTVNPTFGAVSSPAYEGFHAGGSSGGAAAAVSTGMGFGALGTDTIGSIRIPAAMCGVVGLKPSHRTVSTEGLLSLSPLLDTIGPLAPTVSDVALMLNCLAGGSQRVQSLPVRVPHSVRVVSPHGEDPAVTEAASALDSAGADVDRSAAIQADLHKVRMACLLEATSFTYGSLRDLVEDPLAPMGEALRKVLQRGAMLPSWRLQDAHDQFRSIRRELDALARDDAVLLMPVSSNLPGRVGEDEPPDAADITALASAGGHPAVVVPIAGPGPLSVQIVAARGADRLALDAARFIEATIGLFP